MKRTALITGINGQDGTYMAKLLLEKDVAVVGILRPTATVNPVLAAFEDKVDFVQSNYEDLDSIKTILAERKPFYFFNFAAFSTGAGMFSDSVKIGELNGLFVHRILELIKTRSPETRLVQASSREVFGKTFDPNGLSEASNKAPISPYGVSKVYADSMVQIYRTHYGIHASSAILFNHESPLRGEAFVTRKIAKKVAEIKLGISQSLELGDLEIQRDWGYAPDYVEAMYLLANAPFADDYVIATGQLHSVKDFVRQAFSYVNIEPDGYLLNNNSLMRPIDTPAAAGNSTKLRAELGWAPKVSFEVLVKIMVQAELDSLMNNARK